MELNAFVISAGEAESAGTLERPDHPHSSMQCSAWLLICPVLSVYLLFLPASPMAAARPVIASHEASEAPRRSSTKVATTKHLKWTDIEGWRKDNHYIQTGKL